MLYRQVIVVFLASADDSKHCYSHKYLGMLGSLFPLFFYTFIKNMYFLPVTSPLTTTIFIIRKYVVDGVNEIRRTLSTRNGTEQAK